MYRLLAFIFTILILHMAGPVVAQDEKKEDDSNFPVKSTEIEISTQVNLNPDNIRYPLQYTRVGFLKSGRQKLSYAEKKQGVKFVVGTSSDIALLYNPNTPYPGISHRSSFDLHSLNNDHESIQKISAYYDLFSQWNEVIDKPSLHFNVGVGLTKKLFEFRQDESTDDSDRGLFLKLNLAKDLVRKNSFGGIGVSARF